MPELIVAAPEFIKPVLTVLAALTQVYYTLVCRIGNYIILTIKGAAY